MTDQQRIAHERLLSMLPTKRVGDMNDPENWPEADRALSPDELPYIERAAA